MKFFSGFCLQNESRFFDDYLLQNDYTVAGFSYGAVKAAQFALESSDRIDTLQLFSPAFFQCKPERYKRLQMSAFGKDAQGYRSQFIINCFTPYDIRSVEQVEGRSEELDALLNYVWTTEVLQVLKDKGIRIEVYLGADDRIIDSQKAYEFFTPYATVTMIKQANHFLQEQ
ncbi:MAG: pimelyl-ACP methyl ester esterase BioV [Sulfurimonadaceae bacterium]|nr:pimelyl-ACP methyl ester esterase BioV [Sulfurimonadaceae bacterium]